MTEEDLVKLATAYSEHRGLKLTTLGRYVVDDGSFFVGLRAQKTCTVRRANHVISWFSKRWPPDLEWPCGVLRLSEQKDQCDE
ncbi:hypothetical protein [Palleronia caenipelagi]|uniref:Uncharacterized protein n=1 Tax=Palleronia caenipelagi TaxID=2489174 RepID=A0A547PW60_9RHOB|nr:hypothetical protein [Palleronia caenipelagi]TRD18362.1 hypothetical protein FEV53_11950 [Palleronia caenipelagi]